MVVVDANHALAWEALYPRRCARGDVGRVAPRLRGLMRLAPLLLLYSIGCSEDNAQQRHDASATDDLAIVADDLSGLDQSSAPDFAPSDDSAVADGANDAMAACMTGDPVCMGNLLATCGSTDLGDATDCTAYPQAT